MNQDPNGHITIPSTPAEIEEGKTMAIIAYITIFGLLAAFIMNNDKRNPFAKYHIRQSLGLGLVGASFMLLNIIPFLGTIISLILFPVLLIFWIIGLLYAIQGKEKAIPLLGDYFQEWFKTL